MGRARARDVEAFYTEYDTQPGHRLKVFAELAHGVSQGPVLYPGSYVDIAPSVFFDDVHYVDSDKRASVFFSQRDAVKALVASKRIQVDPPLGGRLTFESADYRAPLAVKDGSVTLLISLFAGFISEHCTRYLAPGGHLFVNDSHGDASMAWLAPHYALVGVMLLTDGHYAMTDTDLHSYFRPKGATRTTATRLRETQRGPAYTRRAYAYLFRKRAP